jgi:hypothetical protein
VSTDYRRLVEQLAGGDSDLILRFFVIFSRFEFALKRAGFVTDDRYNNAIPDWAGFAAKLGGQLVAITGRDFIEAKSYLLREPPKKQLFTGRDKTIRWVSRAE